jgi:hypothetical protein
MRMRKRELMLRFRKSRRKTVLYSWRKRIQMRLTRPVRTEAVTRKSKNSLKWMKQE